MIYTIEIFSRGMDVGIGKITQAQYEYWSGDNEMYLDDALNSNFDYDDNETPEDCVLLDYYNEYDDTFFTFGPDADNHNIVIKDSEGSIVYQGDLDDITSEYDIDYELRIRENGTQDYFVSSMEPGYYIQWCHGGKGCYFDADFEDEDFDPTKLKFYVKETDFGEIISTIDYDNEELSNNAGDYDIKSFKASVHYVE